MSVAMPLKDLMFFDIETAREYKSYDDAPEAIQKVWEDLHDKYHADQYDSIEESYELASAFYPEFSKVVVITAGIMVGPDKWKLGEWSGDSELGILVNFANALRKRTQLLAGHNIINFDIPFLCKRYLKHKMDIPQPLQVYNKKPWEIQHVDTYNVWKMGSYSQSASLDRICMMFGIQSPKGEMDGSQVGNFYWNGKVGEVVAYNIGDVIANIKVAYRMCNIDLNKLSFTITNEQYGDLIQSDGTASENSSQLSIRAESEGETDRSDRGVRDGQSLRISGPRQRRTPNADTTKRAINSGDNQQTDKSKGGKL